MEKVLGLYKYVDGINDVPFPNKEQQVITSSFRYDVKRMGGAPMISCTIMHELCLDKLWTDNVYASFNGEKFFIKQTPSSSYDNSDSRYKHEVELVSERIVLDNVYFYDVVDSDASYDKPVSNSSRFTFFGDVREFAERLNQSLKYSKLGYSVVVDSGISSEAKQVSFEDQFFSNVLQEIYNTYNIPYYFSQKVIHIGYTSNAITHTFKYGQDESLLSINKQNANYKIVNRITGVGSQDNIPYYYPNDYESKEEVEANGGTWINPQTNLMPPIYRESRGKERFYSALNNTYINPDSGSYYTFSNPYVDGKPKEHIINFEDIKPSIKGMTNNSGSRIDMFMDFAYDLDDNDDTDEEGNYLHPYFFAKLKRLDGVNGFNLFDHAIEEEEMVISMTSGSCAACEWVIGVDEETQKNTVQVDEQGNLLRDENGNVKFGSAQDRQNDTQNYEVWIALRKDIETFWVILPNATNNYKPSTSDTFVILHIDLPKSYILAAEERLKDSLIKYMSMNNDEKFNFSISFSRIFFAENPSILEQLDENARLQIEYDGERYELYVSSYSYSMTNDKPLPEVRVELSDTLTISQNALQIAINEVKQDILASFGGGDFLKQGLKYFLRKDVDDRSRGKISSDKGFEAGKFRQGILGSGASMYVGKDNNTYIEGDFLTIRKKAFFTNITVQELKHVGGEIVLSPAAMVCCKVEELTTCYRCYFYAEDSEGQRIYNEFEVGDQARCQTFNLDIQENGSFSNRYFWRLVVGMNLNDETVEIDERQCHYIDLSKTDCDSGSDIPEAGDNIVQLGNRNDTLRQNAIVLSAYGVDSPSYKQYNGIKTYSLADADLVTQFSPNGNYIKGKFVSESGTDIEDELGEVKVNWDKVLSQTDKEFTMWFFDYSPSADMLPESDWATDDLKALHEEDLFYNTNVDHEDGGKAWRYIYNEELGKYVWEIVTDAETIKALEKASDAQKTADSKIRNFVSQPVPPYDEGDRWSNATYGELFDDDDLVCVTPKADGESFSIEDWRPVAYGKTSVIKNMEGEIQLLAASFELGSDGKYYLSKEAGVNITSEMASLYATKTEYNTLASKVSSNSSKINTTANSLSAFTEKISFDSSGNVTNISKSGLVTTSNHATLFASEVNNQGIATQSYVRAQVSDGISNITIGADQIEFLGKTIINGNFIVDTSGNLTINGTINAESGLIAGFKISGTSLTNEGFNNDASLIFRNDEYGLFAGIGGNVVPSSTGLRGVARFENHDSSNYYAGSENYTMLVSAQGAQSNVAINMNGGSISGLAIKTLNIGLDNVIQSTAPTYKSVDLDRYVGSVYVSTQYYWKSSSSASSYETKTRNIYLTLPTMHPYDDGHVIKIKRGTNDGSKVYIRAGYTYRNDPNNSYQLTYGSSFINYNEDESATYSSPLAIDGQGDSMTLVYHRDVQRTINGTTYYGCWIQYKHPRDW